MVYYREAWWHICLSSDLGSVRFKIYTELCQNAKTVNIGLKNMLRAGTSILNYLTLFRHSLILGEQNWEGASFQSEVSGLLHIITEGRLRHASGPAQIHRVHYIYKVV